MIYAKKRAAYLLVSVPIRIESGTRHRRVIPDGKGQDGSKGCIKQPVSLWLDGRPF